MQTNQVAKKIDVEGSIDRLIGLERRKKDGTVVKRKPSAEEIHVAQRYFVEDEDGRLCVGANEQTVLKECGGLSKYGVLSAYIKAKAQASGQELSNSKAKNIAASAIREFWDAENPDGVSPAKVAGMKMAERTETHVLSESKTRRDGSIVERWVPKYKPGSPEDVQRRTDEQIARIQLKSAIEFFTALIGRGIDPVEASIVAGKATGIETHRIIDTVEAKTQKQLG